MMVIMLRVELCAVDKPHWTLEPRVKHADKLKLLRGVDECLNKFAAFRLELQDDLRQSSSLMPVRSRFKPAWISRRIRITSLAEVLQSLLPQVLDVRQVADVLSDGPLPLVAPVRQVIIDTADQHADSRDHAAKALDEVGEHPERLPKSEAAL
jgi:hypothetical protein